MIFEQKVESPMPALLSLTYNFALQKGLRDDLVASTHQILDSLQQKGIQATFFIDPHFMNSLAKSDLARHHDVLRRMYAEAHDLQLLADFSKTSLEISKKTLLATFQLLSMDLDIAGVRVRNASGVQGAQLYACLREENFLFDSSIDSPLTQKREFAATLYQPYYASPFDLSLSGLPSEEHLVELPVVRTKMDSIRFAKSDFERKKRLRQKAFRVGYRLARPLRKWVNRLITDDLSFLLTDSKTRPDVDIDAMTLEMPFENAVRELVKIYNSDHTEFVSATVANLRFRKARETQAAVRSNAVSERDFQVAREYNAIMGEDRNYEQSYYLQNWLPPVVDSVLDLGCGAGYWTKRIKDLRPGARVAGLDWGENFIAKAKQNYGNHQIEFIRGDFQNLPFSDESFACVYADNTIEHAFDVQQVLRECYRVLKKGGVLIAAFPSDARNWLAFCDNHTWRTHPSDARARIQAAGFQIERLEELNVFKTLGAAPYSPSKNQMIYVKAKKVVVV